LTTLSCAELASLPEGLGFFAALETIETHGCPKLMELPTWVENLDSLRSLTIPDCYNIKSLWEGLQLLCALQQWS
jgi:structure-specific endonuclease subunit SLX1